jgi:DNA-binding helix-hairpin-helix protein with protein kinase domain
MSSVKDELTQRQKVFCEHYIESGNGTEAAKAAGYSEKSVKQMASENLSKPNIRAYIEELNERRYRETQQIFKRYAVTAFETLVDIAENGRVEVARVNAANSILDRAGYKPVEHSVVKADVTQHSEINEIPADKQEAAILEAAKNIAGNVIEFSKTGS